MNDLALLNIQNAYISFGGISALNNCSLEIHKGAITGIIGPNGAGKTTLFNAISGIERLNKGQIVYKGSRISNLLPHQIFKLGISRTFQIPREMKEMTVLENLTVVPKNQTGEFTSSALFRLKKIKQEETKIRNQAFEVLELVGLNDHAHNFASTLSGGQKKLLEFAKTLMSEPEVVLLDEPAAGVNRTLLTKLLDAIHVAKKEFGTTFVIIEHDMELVMQFCNPVIVLSDGKKIAEGPPQEIRNNPEVLEAYLGF